MHWFLLKGKTKVINWIEEFSIQEYNFTVEFFVLSCECSHVITDMQGLWRRASHASGQRLPTFARLVPWLLIEYNSILKSEWYPSRQWESKDTNLLNSRFRGSSSLSSSSYDAIIIGSGIIGQRICVLNGVISGLLCMLHVSLMYWVVEMSYPLTRYSPIWQDFSWKSTRIRDILQYDRVPK